MGTHVPYGITQCYLPPGRGDIPIFTPSQSWYSIYRPWRDARLSWPGGWLVRGGLPVQRQSPVPALTGFCVEQLRWCKQWYYQYTKLPLNTVSVTMPSHSWAGTCILLQVECLTVENSVWELQQCAKTTPLWGKKCATTVWLLQEHTELYMSVFFSLELS